MNWEMRSEQQSKRFSFIRYWKWSLSHNCELPGFTIETIFNGLRNAHWFLSMALYNEQLAVYRAQPRSWTRGNRKQVQWIAGARAWTQATRSRDQRPNYSATLPLFCPRSPFNNVQKYVRNRRSLSYQCQYAPTPSPDQFVISWLLLA